MKKFMKNLAFVLLALSVITNVLAAQTNPEKPKFALVINAVKPEVAIGSEMLCRIKVYGLSIRTAKVMYLLGRFRIVQNIHPGAQFSTTVVTDVRNE